VSCVLAKSFARIFFRNAINIGLPILECPEAVNALRDGDELAIDLGAGTIVKLSDRKRFKVAPFPEFLQRIMEAGGLMNLVKERARSAS
jgi:3-isopropylmalate/(R)-2-methylmalate dehydratase small subunit